MASQRFCTSICVFDNMTTSFGQIGQKFSISSRSLFVCSRKVKWKSSKYKHMINSCSPRSDSPSTPLSSDPVTPTHDNAPFSFTSNRADII